MITDQHVAATWPELRAESARSSDVFLYFFGQLQGRGASEVVTGPSLWGSASALTRGGILEDRETMAALLPLVSERIDAVAASEDGGLARDAAINLAALAHLDLLNAGLGKSRSPAPEVFVDRLMGQKPISEKFALRAAWAALAHGRSEKLSKVSPFTLNSSHPDQDQDFASSDGLIIDHLYRCILHESGAEEAKPAWRAWIEIFPIQLASDWASWPELLWAARAVHCVIGGHPSDSLLDWLRNEIPS